MCDGGRVLVNGRQAKPAKDVKQGDVIILKFFSRILELEVLGSPTMSIRKKPAEDAYVVKADTRFPRG